MRCRNCKKKREVSLHEKFDGGGEACYIRGPVDIFQGSIFQARIPRGSCPVVSESLLGKCLKSIKYQSWGKSLLSLSSCGFLVGSFGLASPAPVHSFVFDRLGQLVGSGQVQNCGFPRETEEI